MSNNNTFLKDPWSSYQTFMIDNKGLNIVVPKSNLVLYFYNVNLEEEVFIKLVPDQLAESYSPKIISESSFGILHPLNFYAGGSEKKLSFSFSINEDMISEMAVVKDNSIYSFAEKIKRMSEPIVMQGRYKEPLIYMQLGSQFAGVGHITTGFSYKKPFSKGSYKLLDIQVSFVFHEIFENIPISLDVTEDGVEYLNLSVSIPDDILSQYGNSGISSIEDFYKKNLDDSYIVNSVIFSDTMKEKFWNKMIDKYYKQNVDLGYASPVTVDQIKQLLTPTLANDGTLDWQFEQLWAGYTIYWIEALMRSYAKLFHTIATKRLQSYSSLILNFKSIALALDEIEASYNNSYHPTNQDQYPGVGWFQSQSNVYIKMSNELQEMLSIGISELRKIVESQIMAYEILNTGAGE